MRHAVYIVLTSVHSIQISIASVTRRGMFGPRLMRRKAGPRRFIWIRVGLFSKHLAESRARTRRMLLAIRRPTSKSTFTQEQGGFEVEPEAALLRLKPAAAGTCTADVDGKLVACGPAEKSSATDNAGTGAGPGLCRIATATAERWNAECAELCETGRVGPCASRAPVLMSLLRPGQDLSRRCSER